MIHEWLKYRYYNNTAQILTIEFWLGFQTAEYTMDIKPSQNESIFIYHGTFNWIYVHELN